MSRNITAAAVNRAVSSGLLRLEHETGAQVAVYVAQVGFALGFKVLGAYLLRDTFESLLIKSHADGEAIRHQNGAFLTA
jgi:hypothetical protein